MAQQRGVAIEMHTDLAPTSPMIMAAEHEIRDALTNLIFNAVDAMPEGGPLTLRTRVRPKRDSDPADVMAPQFVELEVTDAGVGMDENTRRRCIEPFFSTKGERGTGLGLAMVYGAVQRHSADLEIESALGTGTTIRLSFPVPVAVVVNPTPASPIKAVPPQRILIVDDDPLVLKSLREALEADGHSVTSADGGQAGIDVFHESRTGDDPFSVVITDLGMPYIDGRSVARAVKVAAPDIIVMMLTGWGQRLVADGDIPAQVDRVLAKPPKLRDIREALSQCLETRAPAANRGNAPEHP
jgi:CheY-like chemotaxis protein/anti-sigma regulatory factor (Ser/Thr protein kinase)